MVCTPHRYIMTGLAWEGARYDTEQKLTYDRPIYSNRYNDRKNEEKRVNEYTKREYETIARREYESVKQYESTKQPIQTTLDTPFEPAPLLPLPLTYEPLSPIRPIHIQEEPMTEKANPPNVRDTKRKLAQLIMRELDAIGPREEHTHEDGTTHVH